MTTISERARELMHSGEASSFRDACRILQRRSSARRSANARHRRYMSTVHPRGQDN